MPAARWCQDFSERTEEIDPGKFDGLRRREAMQDARFYG